MASHRGAVQVFHNQIGFALRRLKRGHKSLAAEILPATRELRQKVSTILSQDFDLGANARWPPWRGQPHFNQRLQPLVSNPGEVPCKKRQLEVHASDTTMLPEESCSETEQWSDTASLSSSAPASGPVPRRRHTKRPRRGRRAKSRAHSQMFAEISSRVSIDDGSSGHEAVWASGLGSLLECMEENLYGTGWNRFMLSKTE